MLGIYGKKEAIKYFDIAFSKINTRSLKEVRPTE
jgi:hypothetical protein